MTVDTVWQQVCNAMIATHVVAGVSTAYAHMVELPIYRLTRVQVVLSPTVLVARRVYDSYAVSRLIVDRNTTAFCVGVGVANCEQQDENDTFIDDIDVEHVGPT